ncbi:hypothetical protein EDB83DRAFT_2513280 [Lactarius deliciosus]|nr:hypothetical protein EDB83DRAFT_2513280 [Lactarius deliciosus]
MHFAKWGHKIEREIYIAVKPRRENTLVDTLYDSEVSQPRHPRYHAHLTKEVADLVTPHPETLELMNSWLEHHGISSSFISMTLQQYTHAQNHAHDSSLLGAS